MLIHASASILLAGNKGPQGSIVEAGKEIGERGVTQMVKVSIQVCSATTDFEVAVRAESIQRADSLVAERYPEGDVWVKFPINPEGFFVEAPAARAEIVGAE
jgi:hypothetical protein